MSRTYSSVARKGKTPPVESFIGEDEATRLEDLATSSRKGCHLE